MSTEQTSSQKPSSTEPTPASPSPRPRAAPPPLNAAVKIREGPHAGLVGTVEEIAAGAPAGEGLLPLDRARALHAPALWPVYTLLRALIDWDTGLVGATVPVPRRWLAQQLGLREAVRQARAAAS
jgi:hypothetical protein